MFETQSYSIQINDTFGSSKKQNKTQAQRHVSLCHTYTPLSRALYSRTHAGRHTLLVWTARQRTAMKPAGLPLAGRQDQTLWAGPSLLVKPRQAGKATGGPDLGENAIWILNTLTSVSRRSSACHSQTWGVCQQDPRERPSHRLSRWRWTPEWKTGFHTQIPGQSELPSHIIAHSSRKSGRMRKCVREWGRTNSSGQNAAKTGTKGY